MDSVFSVLDSVLFPDFALHIGVTEAGSGVVSEQRNRLIATIKFICAEIQKRKGYKKKGDCKLKRINLPQSLNYIY